LCYNVHIVLPFLVNKDVHSLYCADVPLSNSTHTHSLTLWSHLYIADRHVRPSKAVQWYFRHGSSTTCHHQCRLYFHVFILYLHFTAVPVVVLVHSVFEYLLINERFVESDDSVH